MSQHDFNIANQGFPATRADINNALVALASTSSGASAPSTTFANQFWYDTANNLLMFRNEADSAWITLAYLDQSSNEWEIRSAVIQAVDSAGVIIKTDDGTSRVTVADDGTVTIANALTVDGDVGIGTSSPSAKLDVFGSTTSTIRVTSGAGGSDAARRATLSLLASGSKEYKIQASAADGSLQFLDSATERMRIDSSGNLLVGKTSTSSTTAGGNIFGGLGSFVRDGNTPLSLNRRINDGEIVSFAAQDSVVGSIGIQSGGFTIDGEANHTGLMFAAASVLPRDNSANTDGTTDLGTSDGRWDDIYATNGTIQTSDRNEKQDIAELSDAEQRVAVAAKGLLRKFRWKDAVAKKGDEARTHFGIIAQDLQAAFAAEGLDAGDYAMFIHSTWTDEETGEEKSRMGVRYSELLAFIIAAI